MNNKAVLKLRELLEVLGANPDEDYSDRGTPPNLEVFGTPASPSVAYSTEPGYSTQIIEAVFMSQYGMYQPTMGDITETRQMGDGEGGVKQYLEIDPPLPPEELAGGLAPALATMSSRGYSVRPLEYGIGFRLEGKKKRDSQLDEAAWMVNEIAARFAYWPERELIRLVLNPLNWTAGSGMYTGADGQRCFSASHTYATGSESYDLPAPTAATVTWSNITTGSGSAGGVKKYASISEVQTDFHSARATLLSRTDAHGEPLIIEQPGGQWIAYCNTLEPTTYRYLRGAFSTEAMPSDDSLRDTLSFNVRVIQTQLLNGVGGTITTSEYADWILAYKAPGARPPLFILDREPLRQAYKADELADVEDWAWRRRVGVGYGDARALQLINAN